MTRYERSIYRRFLVALLALVAVVWRFAPQIDGEPTYSEQPAPARHWAVYERIQGK